MNCVMYELDVARQAELLRFTSGFPDADHLLAAERARIARELHDVVTHSVSVMVLQIGAAREIMRRDERRSRALLESVEPRVISADVAGAVYRIVQEALTNVLKHAAGTPTQVVLRWSDSALELEIVDDGPRQGDARRDASAGRGLAGRRERAAMGSGTLEAHPCADRGYVVRARIPLHSVGARADESQSPTQPKGPWFAPSAFHPEEPRIRLAVDREISSRATRKSLARPTTARSSPGTVSP